MTDDSTAVLAHLRGMSGEMVDLLSRLVDIESPSGEPPSQVPVRAVLVDELEPLGYAVELVDAPEYGDHLVARPTGPAEDRPSQLLIGHMDTVWPLGTAVDRPATVDGANLTGPGSFDMKAGLVQMLYALRSLRDLGLEPPADPVVFVNTDEEIGSPHSRRRLELLAAGASRAFVLERSYGAAGSLKVGRKGVGRYVIRAFGAAS